MHCAVHNVKSLFSGNIVTNDDDPYAAAAVFGQIWSNITNIETTFTNNSGFYGTIQLSSSGYLTNKASTFRYRISLGNVHLIPL